MAKADAVKICPSCGTRNKAKWEFCAKCSESLAEVPELKQPTLAGRLTRPPAEGGVASVFWGLWLFPFATLVIRSGFIPRVFGVLLYIAGGAYLVSSFATLVMPALAKVVGPYLLPLETCEVPIVFWLAIWGAREKPAATPPAA